MAPAASLAPSQRAFVVLAQRRLDSATARAAAPLVGISLSATKSRVSEPELDALRAELARVVARLHS